MANEYEGFEELEKRKFIETRRIAASYQGADPSDDWWLKNHSKKEDCEQGGC